MGVPRVTSLDKVEEGCHWSGSAPDLTKALHTPPEVRLPPLTDALMFMDTSNKLVNVLQDSLCCGCGSHADIIHRSGSA